MTLTLDYAFMDRIDIRQYVGPPGQKAIYTILKSCLDELMRVGLFQRKKPVKTRK